MPTYEIFHTTCRSTSALTERKYFRQFRHSPNSQTEPVTFRIWPEHEIYHLVSGLNRRMITLEGNLIDRVGALEARMAELEDRTDQLVDRIGALATSVNSLVLLVERIAKAQGLIIKSDAEVLRSPPG